MKTLPDEVLSPADQHALETLESAVDQLTPAGRRKLLALLARKSLPPEGGNVTLAGDDGGVFAYLYSAKRPVYDFTSQFTKDELAAIERNLFDPKQHMPLEEVLTLLEAEDGRKDLPR
jgi:hypothetical protein